VQQGQSKTSTQIFVITQSKVDKIYLFKISTVMGENSGGDLS